MKKIVAIFIILLSVAPSYSIYTGKVKLNIRSLRKEIEKKVEKTEGIPIGKISGEIEEKPEVQPPERRVERAVRKVETGPVEKPHEGAGRDVEVVPAREEVEKPTGDSETLRPAELPEGVEAKAEVIPSGGESEKLKTFPAEGPFEETEEKTVGELPGTMTAELPAEPPPALPEESAIGVEEKTETVPPGEEEAKPVDKPEAIASAVPVEETGNRVAVFPFENFSDNKNALKYVMPVLIGHLGKKGVEVVDEERLSEYLCNERVRSTGYVSKELARKIKEKFKVKAILVGSVISFSTGKNPEFGILARLIDPSDGGILWADYASATGEDFTGILGLGRLSTVFSLIPKVMDTLLTSFYVKTLQGETEHSYRIAVMPFQNNTDFRNAGMIAMYMFMVELLKNKKFEPIEYGNIRDLIVSLRIRNRGELDYNNMNVLSEKLGASGILLGAVDNFTKGAAASSPPKAAVSARLLDGGNNKILWYNNRQLSGEENVIAFDWGRIRSVHTVAYRVVESLVKNMGLKQWR